MPIFDDDEGADPRGPCGLQAAVDISPREHGMNHWQQLPKFQMCFNCNQSSLSSSHAIHAAKRTWSSMITFESDDNRAYINTRILNILEDLLSKAKKMPADWTGYELSRYIADAFEKNVRTKLNRSEQRRMMQMYRRAVRENSL